MSQSGFYRPDIDGLRALAVLPVILYHYHLGHVNGGFIGVDVFFVISGYLITSIISWEIASGKFSFARFYERRVRRILPALLTMMIVVMSTAYFVLMPGDYADHCYVPF